MLFILPISLILACSCSPEIPVEKPATSSLKVVPEQTSPELIIVYDNNPFDNRLRTAWGFSCLISLAQETILFDTGGDSAILLDNMSKLSIDPRLVDSIVLSHIHGDHVGGLGGFLEQNNSVTVYLPLSFPKNFKDQAKFLGVKVEDIHKSRELFSGVYTTGELGNNIREQSLIVKTSEGLVIITGCAHPGVVNIVRKAKDILPDCEVYLVIGGFHLLGTSSAQIESIIREFIQLSVKKVAPCHCSVIHADFLENGTERTTSRVEWAQECRFHNL